MGLNSGFKGLICKKFWDTSCNEIIKFLQHISNINKTHLGKRMFKFSGTMWNNTYYLNIVMAYEY